MVTKAPSCHFCFSAVLTAFAPWLLSILGDLMRESEKHHGTGLSYRAKADDLDQVRSSSLGDTTAISTGWRLTFPSDVSRMVACQCAPFVTSADRPAKHGWAHDQSVNNAGVAKGRILSRNEAGTSTPDPDAEACMR
ncbi:hypothetical protein KFL_001080150 [Klebsormidium nitens]|uniref:Uncharacterized protein n=1 Tax=Klebsormidium nitens TaxID=105231 RepID=A0A1Y1HYS0_KLENI|nr:hypothetical protein KFL_001080150 [Klebsormidium nitens]|eukprot:GAQ82339.1 hypothetical protein KFL_001080150 [Klebsormidium nitens]